MLRLTPALLRVFLTLSRCAHGNRCPLVVLILLLMVFSPTCVFSGQAGLAFYAGQLSRCTFLFPDWSLAIKTHLALSTLPAPPPGRGRRLGIQTNFYLHCGTKRGDLSSLFSLSVISVSLTRLPGGRGLTDAGDTEPPWSGNSLLCLCSWSLHSPLSGVWTPLKHSPALWASLVPPPPPPLRSPEAVLSSPKPGSRLPVPGPGHSSAPPAPDPDAALSLVRTPPPGPGGPMGGEQGRKATWRVYSPASLCVYLLSWLTQ